MTTAVTDVLLGRLALRPGDRVLDIGTGAGAGALAAARMVRDGEVVGADISQPLVELARRRGEGRSAANVSFVVADVQHDLVPGQPFDVALSQFGVMFFDAPETAFENIRRQLVAGGRLGFACWQAPDRNPWFVGPALGGLVPPPPQPTPGKSPTHPFSLSDPMYVVELLETSGWNHVSGTQHELIVTVDRDTLVDDEMLGFLNVPERSFSAAWDAIERQLAPIARDDGRIDAPLAFQIFTAIA
ncbi:MAG: class I SAM-dependent methyltransferase [Solirubrobacteraceae bacterium]